MVKTYDNEKVQGKHKRTTNGGEPMEKKLGRWKDWMLGSNVATSKVRRPGEWSNEVGLNGRYFTTLRYIIHTSVESCGGRLLQSCSKAFLISSFKQRK